MTSRSLKIRLLLTCWIVFALHFATNVVREHYPAFSLVDHGTLRVDEYAGFHSDVFLHTDGHHYINNQVACSVVAAVPLLACRPILSSLEEEGRRRAAAAAARGPGDEPEYDTKYPMRRAFFRKVRERGLDLKFGAATAITSVLLMAPLSALFAVLVFGALERRGVPQPRALWLGLLAALGTPVFYRSAFLNHNVLLALALFGSFLLLWRGAEERDRPDPGRRFAAGFLAAGCVALDYAGVIPSLFLAAYLLVSRYEGGGRAGWAASLRAVPAFAAGCVPPALLLFGTQWAMFGDPFRPAQFWMPDQNEFVHRGARGLTAPDPSLFLANLLDLDWGLYAFAPLLVLGLLPARPAAGRDLVLPRRERRAVAAFVAAFLLFCACNQYGWLQWNTGFRYLLPVVPFAFLQASDHLARMGTLPLAALSAVSVLHAWVPTMVRHTPPDRGDAQAIPECWRRFLTEGVQFPWLNVLRNTPSLRVPFLHAWWLPYALLAVAGGLVWAVWRLRRRHGTAVQVSPPGTDGR